ncbi:MAG: O-antigen ligase family protein [Lachnospiraceae bacterium]|nr:O-antigen ligase family protein [Lachnospiraceae bacterium]
MSKKREVSYGTIIGIIGNVLLWASTLAYFLIVPLYFKNGYEKIATYKYQCLMTISKYSAIVIGSFILLYLCTWGFSKEERAVFKPLGKIDIGMLAFIAIAFISHYFSAYKTVGTKAEGEWFYEGSLYGTKGWYMGFLTFLVLVFMYFAISRFFKYTNAVWIPIIVVTSVIFAWGMLNRYGVHPIEMAYANEGFIASLGNINWFAGYVSVLAPVVVGLFYGAKSGLKKGLLIIPLILSHGIVLLNNSDSIVLGYAVMFFFLLCYSLDSKDKMVRFSWVLFSFSSVGLGLFFLDKALPSVKEGTSALSDIFTKGVTAIMIFVACFALAVFMGLCDEGKITYSEKVGKLIRKILLIAVGVGLLIYVVLMIINTKTGGALPIIGDSGVFIFNKNWGSDRGATWTSGWMNFKGLSFGKKLIGAGPDTFYFALKDNKEAFAYAESVFGNSRLTNAHNEIITLLVNVGLLGVGAFIFMCVSAVKRFIKAAEGRPHIIAFALSVICYLANNIFSFQQVTNTPFFFLTIALGAAAVVRAEGK